MGRKLMMQAPTRLPSGSGRTRHTECRSECNKCTNVRSEHKGCTNVHSEHLTYSTHVYNDLSNLTL